MSAEAKEVPKERNDEPPERVAESSWKKNRRFRPMFHLNLNWCTRKWRRHRRFSLAAIAP